jgi:glyoxylase-like metal-dependent hydrolase (beta-lactamase superfamily II)
VTPLPGPLARHRDAADPGSAAARQVLRVGERTVLALSDGVVVIPPDFIGTPEHPTAAHDILRGADSRAPLPLGCFLVPGDTTVLIDAGYGPADHQGRGRLVGGGLLGALADSGFQPGDIDVVALSHLHLDHVGWLADSAGHPTFTRAQVLVGRADWEYFVERDDAALPLADHIRAGLVAIAQAGRLTLLDGDQPVAPGISRLDAAGHTPGHSVFVVSHGRDRALLLGDALYCPAQLTETDWAALTDVDPDLARATRRRLVGDLAKHGGMAVGCHFPGLRAGRVLQAGPR